MNGTNKLDFMIVNLLKYNVLNKIYAVLSHITNSHRNDFQLKASPVLTVIFSSGLKISYRFYDGLFPDYMGILFQNELK
jgi:hypothetical protein